MKGRVVLLLSSLGATVLAVAPGLTQEPADTRTPLRITYVANEGFLLQAGEKAVLIDALFGGKQLGFCEVPTADTVAKLAAAEAPFDQVDLVLVTHQHVDHSDPALAIRFLSSNPEAMLGGPRQVVDRLGVEPGHAAVSSRIKEVTPGRGSATELTVGGISVKVLRLPHSPYLEKDDDTGKMINRHEMVVGSSVVLSIPSATGRRR